MKLLFITQKLHEQDAFTILWVEAWQRRGYDVTVVCLEWRPHAAMTALGRSQAPDFRVRSLGKENGAGKFMQVLRFLWIIATAKYDRVFIHMTPVWGGIGAPVWLVRRTPVYLWYTHYKMQWGLRLIGWYGKRMFAATPQSLPQYPSTSSGQASAKKVIVGHGIDLSYWPKRPNTCMDPKKLLVVHRLARSKRLEIVLNAMAILPAGYTLDVYGIEAEPDYAVEMLQLTRALGLGARVTFRGTTPSHTLPDIYRAHRLILNMASETIDKTMLEAMTCGCYPVTTERNALAIGLPAAPTSDTPGELAACVQYYAEHDMPATDEELYGIVKEKHSLDGIVEKMDRYVSSGT
jgi:glycosyltransferase involved in cell wall biosynthesis